MYASNSSSFVNTVSIFTLSKISASLREMVRSWHRTRFFTSCCVMVLPPPRVPSEPIARSNPRRSTPRCSKKRWSSVATMAWYTAGATSLSFTASLLRVATTRPLTS